MIDKFNRDSNLCIDKGSQHSVDLHPDGSPKYQKKIEEQFGNQLGNGVQGFFQDEHVVQRRERRHLHGSGRSWESLPQLRPLDEGQPTVPASSKLQRSLPPLTRCPLVSWATQNENPVWQPTWWALRKWPQQSLMTHMWPGSGKGLSKSNARGPKA